MIFKGFGWSRRPLVVSLLAQSIIGVPLELSAQDLLEPSSPKSSPIEQGSPSTTVAAERPDPEVRAFSVGEQVSKTVLKGLRSELLNAMAKGGPVHAVSFCNTELPSLTKTMLADFPSTVRVQRVSDRPRNPNNAPNTLDRELLSYFSKLSPNEGAPRASMISVNSGSFEGFHFYQPIFVMPECLACHGSLDQMSPELTAILKTKYPKDKATGYKVGDLRGLLRVSIPQDVIARPAN